LSATPSAEMLEASGAITFTWNGQEVYAPEGQFLVGMNGLELIAPEHRDTVLNNIRTGYEMPYTVEGLKKDGTRYPLEIRGRSFPSQGRTLRVTGFRDLTESTRAKAALEEAYDIITMSPAVVFLWRNEEGWPVEFVTNNVKETFGYTAEEFVGGTVAYAETVHPDDLDRVGEEVARHSAEPSRQRFTHEPYRIVTSDGEVKWLDDRTFIRRDADGRITHFQGIVLDITDRQALAAQLQQAQKMEAVGTLAGGVAHDFNNLLQAIRGFAQVLLLKGDESSPGRRELEEIHQAAIRGGDLSRQLLTFSRKVETSLRPVDLNAEVERIATLLRRTIPRMIAIDVELEKDLKPISGDPGKLEQLVMNLALNAKDAMDDGGTLVSTTHNVTLTEAFCRRHVGGRPGEHVLLRVADSGHGMDQATLERMFEPFYTTKAVGKGSGLGLPIVYGIVKDHDGNITCQSEVGRGTTFEIYLPALEQSAEPGEVETADELQGGTETILLVDDDDAVRDAVRQMLEPFGYSVRTTADGESALELYGREPDAIDLVILDLIMPGMGGRKCLRRILEMNPSAKVLIVSGHSPGDQVREALESGARGFVGKPYGLSRILREIRNILDDRSS